MNFSVLLEPKVQEIQGRVEPGKFMSGSTATRRAVRAIRGPTGYLISPLSPWSMTRRFVAQLVYSRRQFSKFPRTISGGGN